VGSKFTVRSAGEVDFRIASDLDHIARGLVKEFDDLLISLILVGGFGRGEGGVIVDGEAVIPINDYDLVMVTRRRIDPGRVNRIRKRLARELGIWWVDISVYTIAQLRKLRYTMYHYDLKYGSQVIHGDPEVLSLIPPMDPARMPLSEAETEFYTRLWCFLGPFSARFLERRPSQDERFLLAHQLSKAVLACLDALLILKGLYHHSYIERLKRFEQAFSAETELLSLVREATEFKLRPVREVNYDVVARWFQVRRLFLDTMRYFIGQMYRREFRDWAQYACAYRSRPRRLLYRAAYVLMKRSFRYERSLSINLAQLFLVAAFGEEGVDERLLGRAKRELRRLTGRDLGMLDWEGARELASTLRMEI